VQFPLTYTIYVGEIGSTGSEVRLAIRLDSDRSLELINANDNNFALDEVRLAA